MNSLPDSFLPTKRKPQPSESTEHKRHRPQSAPGGFGFHSHSPHQTTESKHLKPILRPALYEVPGPSSKPSNITSNLRTPKQPPKFSIQQPENDIELPKTIFDSLPRSRALTTPNKTPYKSHIRPINFDVSPRDVKQRHVLHSLKAHLISELHSPPPAALATITTTKVARSLEASSHVEIEVASLRSSLDGRLAGEGRLASEEQRGIMLSPGKTHGSGKKLLRNGLAERADHLMTRSRTAYSLWQKEVETQLASSRQVTPDLRLQVMRIVHTSHKPTFNGTPGALYNVLAQCRVMKDDSSHETEVEEGTVLFTFNDPTRRVDPGETVPEGINICVWRPWHEVEISSDVTRRPEGDISSIENVEKRVAQTALLCSRFLVMPP
ncbi:hypothetical protein BD410DRAFT_837210 [Rickenella mellea]|uniref:Uncharacterized protein n=1 Tax=Rickenella mellea TaxID=50990 RepID=A0A4Y7QDH8_9AGAM|nr:hypothetical protein BD410DRAFT_837210 [Rickenella mellea]